MSETSLDDDGDCRWTTSSEPTEQTIPNERGVMSMAEFELFIPLLYEDDAQGCGSMKVEDAFLITTRA